MRRRLPLLARSASTTPALSALLVVVIAVLAGLGVAAPALLDAGRTATVQRAASSLPDIAAWPTAVMPGLPESDTASSPESGVWGTALAAVEAKRQEQPEPLRDLLGEPRIAVAVDPRSSVDTNPDRTAPVPLNRIGLVSDPGLTSRSDVASGRLPELTDPADGIEIVLSEPVADRLAWRVGDAREWDGVALTLTGTVAARDADAADWAFISGSLDPVVEADANGNRILVAAAFMHVDEAAALVDRERDIKVFSWMPFDSSGRNAAGPGSAGLTAANAAQAAAQLRRFSADPAVIPMRDQMYFSGGLAFSSSLPQAIGKGVARADVATAVVTVASVGPILVALVVLALLSRLISVRRVESTRVLRARGASTPRLIALLGGEGAALGAIGAAIGAGAASAAVGWAGWWALAVPAAFAAVPAVALPWGALVDAERRGRRDLGDAGAAGGGRTGWGRAALEILALAATGVLAVLVATGGRSGGAGPLPLALLVLLGLSGSVLTLRVLPSLLRLAEARGRRRASLASLLGPARAGRDRVVRAAPVLAVVVGLGVAVFSVAFSATVSGGIVRAAEAAVGADVRVTAAYIDPEGAEAVAAVDGVAGLAALHDDSSVEASSGGKRERARLYTLDRDAFTAVQRGHASPLPLPAALGGGSGGSTGDGSGTESDAVSAGSDPVPVVVSERLLARLGAADADALTGETDPARLAELGLELEVGGVPVRVVGVARPEVPFGTAEQWVIVDGANAAALGERGTGISQLYLAVEPDVDAEAVGAEAVAALDDDAAGFETPGRAAAVHTGDPAYGVVQASLLMASAVVAALVALATIATLMLGAASRARMLAVLRTLGYPTGASGGLVAWEAVPALLTALPFGVGAGIAMARLVIPQLDLGGFVGGAAGPPVDLGGFWLPLVVAGFSAVAALAIAIAAALAGRLGSASAIRSDDAEAG